MIPRPPRSTRTDTLFPYTTLFRSHELKADAGRPCGDQDFRSLKVQLHPLASAPHGAAQVGARQVAAGQNEFGGRGDVGGERSEEHTSELQSLMRISYDVFCLKKKTQHTQKNTDRYRSSRHTS